MIAAPSSGAGKTVLTAGLLRALRQRGLRVAAAKSGPDYIDPAFHAAASGADCVTLDAWAMPAAALRARAIETGAELLVVEAAMGLLDAAPAADRAWGRGSAAELAAALGAPVVLVLDVARQGQSAAALALGLKAARPDLDIAGVILNRVGSERHRRMIERACAAVGVSVLGAVGRDAALATPSRHLGLVQARERADLDGFLDGVATRVAAGVDLDRLRALAKPIAAGGSMARMAPLGARIAIARDDAFAFLYPHLLSDWRRQGAALSFFSPLADQAPAPEADAVFLPGGYPELHGGALAAASRFKTGVGAAAARGAAIYGECGGYMTLGEGLLDEGGARHAMLGLLPLETSFAERKLQLGYRRLIAAAGAPLSGAHAGHEFHYATILRQGAAEPLFEARDAEGAALAPMGQRQGRVFGSFAHLIAPL